MGKNGPRLYSTYNIIVVKCGGFEFRFLKKIFGPSLVLTLIYIYIYNLILFENVNKLSNLILNFHAFIYGIHLI